MTPTRPTLTISISSHLENRVLEFSQNQIKIGRTRSSDVCLKDETVGLLHAVIEDAGDGFYVMDLGSLTGTIVNGKRTNKAPLRKSGDIIKVGSTILQVVLGVPSGETAQEAAEEHEPKTRAKVEPRTWEEFRESGLLWWVNRALHLFGWALCFEYPTQLHGDLKVYPARVDFKGFAPEVEKAQFANLEKHLKETFGRE